MSVLILQISHLTILSLTQEFCACVCQGLCVHSAMLVQLHSLAPASPRLQTYHLTLLTPAYTHHHRTYTYIHTLD
ncbi:hypothetical protein BDY21DRAFT_355876 [Lineolata rhizophorae]|uniref:Secreted protein n=1 Tax=Lineolata rhizophorae TaxID=578093 RepID=A0A6A6NNZ8_9PEZI|nr:hypothetical protein BDY21DRAFT_355876 [Lineolata rhizophorae]